MTQQLHRSPYDMFVIGPIASMKFLPIMKIDLSALAALERLCSHMRKHAGKTPCSAAHPYSCGRKTISDFGDDRTWPDLQ